MHRSVREKTNISREICQIPFYLVDITLYFFVYPLFDFLKTIIQNPSHLDQKIPFYLL